MSRYLAFISYRHKDRDRRIAGLLRRGLENWHLPKNAPFDRKGRRVFRDTDELPTSANLGADIENALEESQWLIALCSESYVESKWCRRELEIFIGLGRKDHILPVLIGEKAEDCFPDLIRDLPVAVKIEQKDRSADRAIAALLARMAEEPSEAYVRYFRAEKSCRALRYSAIACTAVAAIAGLTVYANLSAARIAQNNERIVVATQETVKAEQEAKEERNRAMLMNARMLSVEAWAAIDEGDTDRAVDLSLSALPENLHGDEPVSDEAVSALRAALSSPAKHVDEWECTKSIETDFEIKGYVARSNLRTGLVLLDGHYGLDEHILNYDTAQIEVYRDASREKAAELGYSMGYWLQRGGSIYYGPGEKMIASLLKGQDGFLLGEEYVYADHLFEVGYYYVLTWLEEPEEGKKSPACMIDIRQQNAIMSLDITGHPISASFTRSDERIAVVDEAGDISIFSMNKRRKVAVLPGNWKQVYFPDDSRRFVCIDEEGKAYLYDMVTMAEVFQFDCPFAIRSMQYCWEKDCYLALCEDAVRIFESEEGKVLTVIPFCQESAGEVPQFAVYEQYEEDMWMHKGNAFYLIYDRRVDKYEIETQVDLSQTDYIPLYEAGLFSECAKAFYSKDSRYVYRQEYQGQLSKWDAKTGEFLWANEDAWNLQGNVHDDAIESLDGKFLWRANNDMSGLEKVDALTGETVYSVGWKDQTGGDRSIRMPAETTGSLAVSATDSHKLIGFDKYSGELLWIVDAANLFGFSADEELIYAFGCRETANERQIVYKGIQSKDGKTIREDVVFSMPKEYGWSCQMKYDHKTGVFLLTMDLTAWKTPEKTGKEKTYYVYAYDIMTGKEIDHWELDKEGVSVLSYTGKMAYYWTEADDDPYCVELLPNGALGEKLRVATKEGRMLTATDYDSVSTYEMPITAKKTLAYGRFCGDDVVMDYVGLSDSIRITRISDGAILLDIPDSNISKAVAMAPDGSGACIYGYYTTPRIILASDVDALVEKARRKQGGRTQ